MGRLGVVAAALALSVAVSGQTTLVPGDIVVIGMAGDTAPGGGGTGKSLSFVPLVDLMAGTGIHFTDSGWLGASFRANEGGATYTAPASGLTAGTLVTASGTSNPSWAGNGDEWTAPPDGVGNGGMNFSTSGDQVLVFQGDGATPSFVFALNGASAKFSQPADVDNANETALPTGLATGATAVAAGFGPGDSDEYDNVWYSGAVTAGTREEILAAVVDPANWTGDNTDYSPKMSGFAVSRVVSPEPTNYPTAFSAVPGTNSIRLTWTDSTGGQLPRAYMVKARRGSAIVAPVDGVSEADDKELGDGSGRLNVLQGVQSARFDGLTAGQTYRFAIFPYSNADTNIDYKTDGTVPEASAVPLAGPSIVHEEGFESGTFDSWTPHSVSSDRDWGVDSTDGGADGSVYYAHINGYFQDMTSNDWLISPALDLDGYSSASMVFWTHWRYGTEDPSNYLKLKYSIDYDGIGNPAAASWAELTFTRPPGSDDWVQSGTIDLDALVGQTVHLAFHYYSEDAPRRWRVDEIKVHAEGTGKPGLTLIIR